MRHAVLFAIEPDELEEIRDGERAEQHSEETEIAHSRERAGQPLIGGGGAGASPYRFRGGTLIDWMRVKDARSRALSVSRKDRGAILPMGRAHESVVWYASDGRFTTSRFLRGHVAGVGSGVQRSAPPFIAFPWMDEVTVQFALAGTMALDLGRGPAPDLLAVSLSTTDPVGHRFGIASRLEEWSMPLGRPPHLPRPISS